MRFRAVLLVTAFLAACDRKIETAQPEQAPEAPAVAEVAAADSYGEPGEEVNDVAFWSHPSVAFESLLLAVTDAAIDAFAVETGERVFALEGGADSIAVFYAGAGSPGHLIAGGDGAYRIFAVAADGKSAAPLGGLIDAGADVPVFCVRSGPAPAVYEIAGGAVAARTLTIVASRAELGAPVRLADAAGAVACHVDPFTDNVITVAGDGAIRRIDAATGTVFGIALPAGLSPVSSGLAAGRTETGDPALQVALLDGATGSVSLFDAGDGHALGAVRVKATFDLTAVGSASQVAIGSANYGGVYRDGALAVVTAGEGAPVRLVPWNGVMGALSLPVLAVPDARTPRGETAEEDVISIEVIEP